MLLEKLQKLQPGDTIYEHDHGNVLRCKFIGMYRDLNYVFVKTPPYKAECISAFYLESDDYSEDEEIIKKRAIKWHSNTIKSIKKNLKRDWTGQYLEEPDIEKLKTLTGKSLKSILNFSKTPIDEDKLPKYAQELLNENK